MKSASPNHTNHSESDPAPITISALSPNVARVVLANHPELGPESQVSSAFVNQAREDYIRQLLQTQLDELTHLEEDVVESMRKHEFLTDHPQTIHENLTLGQRLADHIAGFGGSWRFISAFGVILGIWIIYNLTTGKSFDPLPLYSS